MIGIKNDEIASQFSMTFLLMDKPLTFDNVFVLDNNNVYLSANGNNNTVLYVSLDNSKIGVCQHDFHNLHVHTIPKDNVVWGMCNMVNNALQQWMGCTPFIGADVCNDLSKQATKELGLYGLSLLLTPNYMKILDKTTNHQITFEDAMNKILNFANQDTCVKNNKYDALKMNKEEANRAERKSNKFKKFLRKIGTLSNYDIEEEEETTYFKIEHAINTSIIRAMISMNHSDCVTVYYSICKLDNPDRLNKLLIKINNINNTVPSIRTYITEQNIIMSDILYVTKSEDFNSETLVNLLIHGMNTIQDTIYPQIMKSIWS